MNRRTPFAFALAALGAVLLTSCGGHAEVDWPRPNLNLASTRALPRSGIDAGNVRHLRVAWRFRFRAKPHESGVFTATPVVADGVVYAQDLSSNVFALDLDSGRLIWRHLFKARNPGPNGLAVDDGRVYGVTDTSAFALDASGGRLLWRRFLVTQTAPFVEVAPQVAGNLVYASTIGEGHNGRGVLYALDAGTGAIRWRFGTIKNRWRFPAEAGGGGAWYPPSLAGNELYWGTANPYPYGGTREHPNGGAFAGPALYTDSLLALDARRGTLRWYDQVTRHDVRDYDFQLPPILGTAGGRDVVFGAGKAGVVIAWDRKSHRRLWETRVGTHRNDVGPLPSKPVSVCPGLLGGVETPMAFDGRRLYVPVVDLCIEGGAFGYEPLDRVDVLGRGRGELVALDAATGRKVWALPLSAPTFGCATVADGVVFTSTLGGHLYAVDTDRGTVLWTATLRGGVNACPSLARGLLIVGGGVRLRGGDTLELVAFRTRD